MGPSLLWESSQNAPMRTLPTLIEMLINNCQTLFGVQVVALLGEVANDSGAEESDSLHCKLKHLSLISSQFEYFSFEVLFRRTNIDIFLNSDFEVGITKCKSEFRDKNTRRN